MLGGHVAALPERTLAEEACDFVIERRRPSHDRRSAERAPGERPTRTCLASAASSIGIDGRVVAQRGRAARERPRRRDAGRRVGSAADDALSRAQLALLRRSRARAVRRDLHDARLPVPLLVLLHPGAVQGGRAGARPASRASTATASGARRASSTRSTCSSTATASATSSSPTRCSC